MEGKAEDTIPFCGITEGAVTWTVAAGTAGIEAGGGFCDAVRGNDDLVPTVSADCVTVGGPGEAGFGKVSE